jgi:hypothetical protein
MFSVSEKSQVARLKEILAKNKILVDGRVQAKHDSVHFEAVKQISSILTYLHDIHGFGTIQPWFAENLRNRFVGDSSSSKSPELVAKMMGIEYVRVWQVSSGGTMILTADRDGAIAIDGYDRILRGQHVSADVHERSLPRDGFAYRVSKDLGKMNVTLSRDSSMIDSLQIDLQPLINRLVAEYGTVTTQRIPTERMAVAASGERTKVKFFLTNLRFQRAKGEMKIMSYEGDFAYTISHER